MRDQCNLTVDDRHAQELDNRALENTIEFAVPGTEPSIPISDTRLQRGVQPRGPRASSAETAAA